MTEDPDDLWSAYDKAVGEDSDMWRAEFRRRIERAILVEPLELIDSINACHGCLDNSKGDTFDRVERLRRKVDPA